MAYAFGVFFRHRNQMILLFHLSQDLSQNHIKALSPPSTGQRFFLKERFPLRIMTTNYALCATFSWASFLRSAFTSATTSPASSFISE